MSSRIENFLKTFGLENCRYKAGASGIPALTSCDGSEIILKRERSKVRAYLSKALNIIGE